jgi:ERCC4-type nuclease
VKLIRERGVEAEWEMLEVGDYQMRGRDGELVIVTRKAGDLLQSLYSGHFSEEIQKCLNLIHSSGNGKLVFICEGPWGLTAGGLGHYSKAGPDYYRKASQHSATGAMMPNVQLSLQAAGAFEVYTTSVSETADALVAIYQRAQEGWPSGFTKGLKRPELKWSSDTRVARLMALWPHLTESVAVRLLDQWGSILTILEAAEADPSPLLDTKGLGPKGIQNLLSVIN